MRSNFFIRVFAACLVACAGRAVAIDLPSSWWRDHDAALAEARRTGRPAVVYFDAVWCSWCERYKREVLTHAAVREALAGYVATVVDYDARTDLAARYGVHALPFTVIISAQGRVLDDFAGVLAAPDMVATLRARETDAVRGPATGAAISEPRAIGALDCAGYAEFRAAFLAHLEPLYDEARGTLTGVFETGATLKRPSPLTWLWLLRNGLWPDRTPRAAIAESRRLWDRVDSGFFNFVDPGRDDYLESSKLLESNAWMAAWMAQAGRREAAWSAWLFLDGVLWDAGRGGFWQAQIAENDYYLAAPSERMHRRAPGVDTIKRADTNAAAAWALTELARIAGWPAAGERARMALEFLLREMWRDGRLRHSVRDGQAGIADVPADWFWLLAAAQALGAESDPRVQSVAAAAAAWLAPRLRQPARGHAPGLLGLIAWVAGGRGGLLPYAARDWALTGLVLPPSLEPDLVVIGLWAWERALGETCPR